MLRQSSASVCNFMPYWSKDGKGPQQCPVIIILDVQI